MEAKRYNHPLDRLQSIGINLKEDELGILELFVQTGALTTMEITKIIKSTKLEMAYKNVYYNIQQLKNKKLIENIGVKRKRNNEKYFRLTDDGIYQLFLRRLY